MRVVRSVLLVLFAWCAAESYAATTIATVMIDVDNDPLSGCAAEGGASGFERALITTVDITASTVVSVQRRDCAAGAFNTPVNIGGPWPAGIDGGTTRIETRIAFTDLPSRQRGDVMRLAFFFTNEQGSVSFTTMPDGSPIYYPAARYGRRRSVRPADGTQLLLADGNVDDWARLQPLLDRGMHAMWVHGARTELFFRFDVRASSQPPVASDDAYAVRQGQSLVVDAPGVLANDTDPEGSALSAELVAPAAHGSVSLAPDGSFVYSNDGTLGGDGFDYKASDGAAESEPARVTISVTPNSAPVAQDDTFATTRGGTLTVPAPGVLANDGDADGDALTAAVATAPARGTVAVAPDGSFTYTHNGSTEPSDTFTYTVSDGLAHSAPAAVTIHLSASNAPPVAVDDVFHVVNGGTLDVTAPGLFSNDLDSDTPQSQWTTTVVAGVSHGVLTLGTGGAFTYVHDGSGASDSFTYRISDGNSQSNVATVTITVGAANAPPVANADTYTVDEDGTLTVAAPGILGNDTDPEGAILTVVAGDPPTHGTLTLNANGSFTYVPQPNYFGTDSFTYAASDGALSSASATVTINVTAVNDAPVTAADAYTVAEGATLTVPAPGLLANDTDVDDATLTAFSSATNVTVNADGSFTYVHDGSETAADSFTYEARDGVAATTGTAAITVTEVNDPPFADADSKATAEDTPLTFPLSDLLANDNAGDGETTQTISLVSTSDVQHGVVAVSGGNITFTPDPNFAGTASFRYTITDDGTTNGVSDPLTAFALVTVNVIGVNDTPVAAADALTTDEDVTLTVPASTLLVNDNAGANESTQTLTITAVSDAVNGTVALDAGNVVFTPQPGFSGTATFNYTITDNGTTNGAADPLTGSATVTITVHEINDAPAANDDAKSTPEDTPLTFPAADLTANDSAGALEPAQTITVTSVANAVNGTVSLSGGNITFTPAAHFSGTATFTYTITDNGTPAMTASATVTVTVTEVNEAPVAADDAKATNEDVPLTFPLADLLANDSAGPGESTQTLTLVLGPATNGTVAASGANITFTPDPGFNGTASFTYTITDNGTTNGLADPLSDSATVTVTVADVNDVPVANGDAKSTTEDAPLTFAATDLVANDSAGADEAAQTITVTNVANATNGTVSLAAGNITFTPAADFHGVATFEYTITDDGTTSGAADPLTATATVTITITETNDAPVAAADAKSVAENGTLTFAATDLVANDNAGPNEATQTLSVTAVNNATNGTVSLSGGNVTFVPAADFNGTATFEYTITDDGTTNGAADPLTATATVTVTVSETNAAPVATNDAKSAVEDVVLTFAAADLTVNDHAGANETSQTLTVTAVSNASSGTVSLSGGSVTFTPAADFNGVVTFDYTVTDDGTTAGAADPRTAVGSVTITVSEVNDAPTATGDSKTTDEDTSLVFPATDLLSNDTHGAANESGQTLTVTAVSNATNGTVVLAGGTITFTPNANFNGTASFDYTISDDGTTAGAADARTASGTVNVTVREVNDTPVATGDAKSVAENGTLTFPATDLVANDNAGPLEGAQTITVTSVGTANNGTVALASGTITFTPDADFNGTATFEYTITDNGTTNGAADPKSATATVTVPVSEVNAAPVANDDTASTTEDAGTTIAAATLLANDTAGPNEAAQTLTIIGVANATNGTVSLSGTDVIFTPAADYYGVATFEYTITDNGTTNGTGDPKTSTGTVSVTVTEVNDTPAAAADAKSVAENAVLSFAATDLLSNDSKGANEASQTLTVTAVSNPSNGTVDLTTGTITFTPDADFNGTASFDYTITDDGTTGGTADPLTSTGTVTVTVSEVNAAPVATDDAKAMNEDGVLSFSASDLVTNDSAGANEATQTLTVTAVSNASSGTVSLSGGTITFTPAANFNGTATFDYTLTDDGTTGGAADAKSDTGTVTVTIAEINDAPVAVADAKSTAEDAALIFAAADLLANDTKGAANESAQTLSVTSVSNASNGTVSLSAGDVTFTPDADFYGTASFDYTITDDGTSNGASDAKTATATVLVTVTEINDAPSANDDTKTMAENGTLSFSASDLVANDTKGTNEASQTLTVTSVGTASSGSVTLSSGTITVTPDADFNGTITFDYTMTDDGTTNGVADPKTATATVTVTVTEVNDAPVAGADAAATAEDNAVAIDASTLLANDTEGAADETAQTLSVTAVGNAVNGSVALAGTTITFTPSADYNGAAATFEYTVTDDGTTNGAADPKSSTGTVTVTVSEVNDAPTAVADVKAATEDTALIFDAADLVANDNKGAANESAQTLTVTAVANPTGGTVALNSGNITFTPAPNFNGAGSFEYTITDNGTTNGAADAKTSTGSVTVNVAAVNDPPVAVNDSYAYPSSGNLAIAAPGVLANDSDVEGTTLTAALVAAPSADDGTLVLNADGSFTFTRNAPAGASTSFTYSVSDGTAAPVNAVVTITFNTPPSAVADTYQVLEDSGATTIAAASGLLSNDTDSDGDTLTISGVTYNSTNYATGAAITTAIGTLTVQTDGGFTYTPNANEFGAETFSYTLSDGTVTTTGSVTLTTAAVNDQPSFTKGANVTINEDSGVYNQPWATAISRGPANESTQTLTFTAAPSDPTLISGGTMDCVSVPDAGDPSEWAIECTVTITGITVNASTGNLSFTPQTNRNGSFTLGVKLMDNGGTANGGQDTYPTPPAVETINVTINPVNDAPTFTLSQTSITQREDQNTPAAPLNIAAFARNFAPGGGADEASQSLVEYTVRAADATFFHTLSINPTTGDLVMVPAANSYGNTNIYVKLKDSGGTANGGVDTFERAVPVSYLAINDAPILTLGPNVWVAGVATAQTYTNWASAVVGPPNEVTPPPGFPSQTISQYLVSVPNAAHQALFSVQPAIAVDGTLTFTPAAGANGNATVNVQVRDSGPSNLAGCCQNVNTSAVQTFTISIGTTNSPPSFTLGANPSVPEESAAQTVTNFITAVSPGANAADVGQTVTFSALTNNNNGLFNVQPALVANGANYDLTFTPKPNTIGTATVTVTATDSGSNTAPNVNTLTKTFTITVTNVNDMPSFTVPANAPSSYDSAGPQTVTNFATSINRGAPHEASDILTFVVSGNTNPSLFSNPPAISPTGTLTYTGAAGAVGTATITVYLKDDGGTWSNTADDLQTVTQSFTITIVEYTGNVNDPPTFTITNQSVAEDSGAQAVNPFITNIGQGGDDTGQTVTFTLSGNTNTALFSAQPALSGTQLTYTPAANANGTATLTVTARDNGGTAGGGNDTTVQTFTITVTPVNDAPNFTGSNVYVASASGTPAVHTFTNWATGVNAGPSNESTQTLTRSVTVTAGANLFTAGGQPALSTNTLTFTTEVGQSGTATIEVTFTDNGGLPGTPSVTKTYTIGVGVNSPPSFVSGGNVTRSEDSGAHSIAWATSISAGFAYETGQTITFDILSNSNTALFAAGPVVQSNGALEFTTAANRFGSATIQVRIKDDGGTPLDSSDDLTGNTVTFTIALTNVNDPPTFTIAGNPPAVETGATNTSYSVSSFATAISPGPFETGTVSFIVTANNNSALFSTQPAINSSGTLTYTVAANQTGTADVTVKANDGSLDSISTSSFTITVVAAGALTPVAPARSYQTTANMTLTVSSSPDRLLDGVTDPTPATTPLVVTTFTNVDSGATATLTDASTGAFTYKPRQGFTGTDTFNYTICDGTGAGVKCSTGTISMQIVGPIIYYVNDDAPAGGDGSIEKPFNATNVLINNQAPNAFMFVYSGTYSAGRRVTANLTIVGQGAPAVAHASGFGTTFASYFGITAPTGGTLAALPDLNAGTAPVFNNSGFVFDEVGTGGSLRNVRIVNTTGGTAIQAGRAGSTVAIDRVRIESSIATSTNIAIQGSATITVANSHATNAYLYVYPDFNTGTGPTVSFTNTRLDGGATSSTGDFIHIDAPLNPSAKVTFDAASQVSSSLGRISVAGSHTRFEGPVTVTGTHQQGLLVTGGAIAEFIGVVTINMNATSGGAAMNLQSSTVVMSNAGNSITVDSEGIGGNFGSIVAGTGGINLGAVDVTADNGGFFFLDTSGAPITITSGTIRVPLNNAGPCVTRTNAPNVSISPGVVGVGCTIP